MTPVVPPAGREGVDLPGAPPDDIRLALQEVGARAGAIGHTLHYVDSAGSTNDIARECARSGVGSGLVVCAGQQTAGRGQRGRSWFSPADAGLYVSVLLDMGTADVGVMTLGAGVALAEGLRAASGVEVRLKWPNDLVTDGEHGPRRKLGGILAEGIVRDGSVRQVVLGFGINLRTAAFPPDLAGVATSLEDVAEAPVSRRAVLAETLVALDQTMHRVCGGAPHGILDRWRELSPSATGARVRWTAAGGVARIGTTEGIDHDGALLVRTRGGLERLVSADLLWD